MATRPKVLLVEDDPRARRLFAEAITDVTDAELVFATDGREALERLPPRNGRNDGLPDLIVLDLDLPGIDGLSVLEEYRASNSPVRLTPILILSGTDDQPTVDEAYEAGANAFLAKPDDYAALVELVRAVGEFWLDRVRRPSS